MRTKHTGYDISEATARYDVVVSNIGIVYIGNDRDKAKEIMQEYISISKADRGRAAGESVTLLRNDDIISEYVGLRIDD